MATTDHPFRDVLDANEWYASRFELGHLPALAARGLAIVTCFDSRIEPLTMLGLTPGDAKIIRVAGGRVSDDVLDSLALATDRLGVERIAIVQHTDCAAPETGVDTLVADVERVLADERIGTGVAVVGLCYDVRSGELEELVPPRHPERS